MGVKKLYILPQTSFYRMSLGMNRKGQEAAPFELLIAVIIMGFVLAVGFMAMSELSKKQCQGSIETTMSELKTSLEIVAKGQGKTTFAFRMPPCYTESKSRLGIRNITERIVCSRICGGNRIDCTVLEFYGYSEAGSYVSVLCLDIPATVDFPSDVAGSPCDPDKYESGTIEYEVVSWKDGPIIPGDYILVNEYTLMSDYPRICAYKRSI